MAPRGRERPRKKNNTRTDAALDAMRLYGFSEDLILKKLKELLDVYGEEHWLFIEENSYKVLLESILEEVEKEEQQKDDTVAGTSSGVLALPYSETEALSVTWATNEHVGDLASHTDEAWDTALLTYKSDGNDHLPSSSKGTGTGQQDGNLDRNSGRKNTSNVIETDENICHANLSCNHHQELGFPIRRRRPCHGWICSDDEDNEPDLVELEPEPLPEEFVKLLNRANQHRKRKTRWD